MERFEVSVLDASVVLKWFIEEDDSQKAVVIRQAHYDGMMEVIVPDLLIYEVANALRYNPDYDVVETQDAIQTLFDLDMNIVAPTMELLNKTIDIAVMDNITWYDALYLALAEEIGEDFSTADEKLLSRLSGNRKNISHLLKEL